jgi:GT2 family glycosyltransferase
MTNSVRFEVILADDASSDATIQMVRQLPWLRVWRSERNRGFLDTCNAAAVMARGDVLLLLNNDTLVGDQALDQIWSTFQRRPKAGVVGAAFWGADGYPQEVGGIVWASGQVWNHGRGFPPMRWFALEGERHCDYVSGCGLSIRHSLWQQLEGFDPLYRPAYAEDTDLCLRVRQAGHEVWVQPQARILHLEGLSHSRDSNQGMKQHQAVNLLHLKERWQTYLDAQQPPEGLPWLLAADRGLLGRPLAVLLEPALEAKSICMQLGWAPLVVDERWSFQWLVQHLNGPLLPEIALVGEPPAGCPIPEGWMQRDYPAQLPQRSSASKLRLPGLPGWDREDLRVLASSTGLHPDGWLETDSRIVVERMKESRPTEALRIQLYLPEEGPEGAASRAQIKFESEAKSLHVILQEGLNNVNLHPSRDADTCLVINIKSQSVIRPKDMQDQRQLLAVLADIGMIEEG